MAKKIKMKRKQKQRKCQKEHLAQALEEVSVTLKVSAVQNHIESC